MRDLFRISLVTIAIAVFITGCSHFHGHHSHSAHHEADRSALTLNNGEKWATDTPLRTGMMRIRDISTSLGEQGSVAQIDAATRTEAADGINDQVAFLIANCELEPKADAALHVLISDMLQGAEKLRQPETAGDGAALISESLAQYPAFFDDPDW